MTTKFKRVKLKSGQYVVLVPRSLLRLGCKAKTPRSKRQARDPGAGLPAPPPSWDGSKGRSIRYPVLGNDQEGDCYYADLCHCVQTWTGNAGQEVQFNAADVLRRYEQLSGGDNGLGDSDVFPEWKSGIIGPDGPNKILDDLVVDPRNDALIRQGMWLFCGASWTCSLLDTWLNNAEPGATWDAGGRPDPGAGHAMHLSGYAPDHYQDETWGFDPPIKLTPAGLKAADPEVTLQFSLEMFAPDGIAPHNGLHYEELAAAWEAMGGVTLPPSPFGPPPPVPPPPGPGPGGNALLLVSALAAGSYPLGGGGLPTPTVAGVRAVLHPDLVARLDGAGFPWGQLVQILLALLALLRPAGGPGASAR